MSILETAHDGPVLRVTLNRPGVRNAFDEDVIAALIECAREATRDESVRAIVLAGAGKAFCAGADLAWMSKAIAYTQEENLRDAEDLARMLETLDSLRVPLIGRVHGAALGGGVGLCAVCDIVVAAADTVFAFSEVRLGILPAVIAPYVLGKIGTSAARELFLTGNRFDARRARELGLVHEVVAEAELDAAVDRYLGSILTSAPGAIAASKKLIREIHAECPADVIGITTGQIATQRVSPEGQEGMRAFLEKRRPSWSRPL